MLIHVQLARGGVKQDPPSPLPRPGVVSRRQSVNPQAQQYLERIRDIHRQQRAEAN